MSIDTIEQPAVVSGGLELNSDPFDLDVGFIESGPNADAVIARCATSCLITSRW